MISNNFDQFTIYLNIILESSLGESIGLPVFNKTKQNKK